MRPRINEIARFTKQPHALAEFYAGILGRPVPDAGRDAYNFEVEGLNLFIHVADDQPSPPGWPEGVDHIAFEVDDLDEECARLAAAGYEITGPLDSPGADPPTCAILTGGWLSCTDRTSPMSSAFHPRDATNLDSFSTSRLRADAGALSEIPPDFQRHWVFMEKHL